MRRLKIDGRSVPFCWQEKEMLRKIDAHYQSHPGTKPAKPILISTYVALTRIASDYHSEEFSAPIERICNYSGLSDRTVQACVGLLNDLSVIKKDQSSGRSASKYELLNTESGSGLNPEGRSGLKSPEQRREPQHIGVKDVRHNPEGRSGLERPYHYIGKESSLKNKGEKNSGPIPSQIVIFKSVTGFLPLPVSWEKVSLTIGKSSAEEISPYFAEWVERGHNKNNLAWLFEWFVDQTIPAKKYSRSSIRHSDEPTDDWRNEPGAEERNRRAKENADKRRAEEQKKAAAEKSRRSK